MHTITYLYELIKIHVRNILIKRVRKWKNYYPVIFHIHFYIQEQQNTKASRLDNVTALLETGEEERQKGLRMFVMLKKLAILFSLECWTTENLIYGTGTKEINVDLDWDMDLMICWLANRELHNPWGNICRKDEYLMGSGPWHTIVAG